MDEGFKHSPSHVSSIESHNVRDQSLKELSDDGVMALDKLEVRSVGGREYVSKFNSLAPIFFSSLIDTEKSLLRDWDKFCIKDVKRSER